MKRGGIFFFLISLEGTKKEGGGGWGVGVAAEFLFHF